MPALKKQIRIEGADIARFWNLVATGAPEDCWPFQGSTDRRGYGRFKAKGVKYSAHRVAFFVVNGDPGQLEVCHRCDNPSCCNPAHHWLGTSADNTADMLAKGRGHGMALTHCHAGHEFTEGNIYRQRSKPFARLCRACACARRRGYRAKKSSESKAESQISTPHHEGARA